MDDPKRLRRTLEPVRNRLRRFVENEQFRRIFFPEGEALHFAQAFAKNEVIIANLQEKGEMNAGNIRLLGMMILHEIAKASERSGNRKEKDYFLILDEAADFIVPSLRSILDKGAGKGMHLGVFHQTLSQLSRQDAWVYESVLSGARMKVIFGGISKQNANVLAGNIYTNKWERDTELAAYLTRQPQRHFTLARPNKEVEHLTAPNIEYADLPEDYRDELIVKYFIEPYGKSVAEIDARLAERRKTASGMTEAGPDGEAWEREVFDDVDDESFWQK